METSDLGEPVVLSVAQTSHRTQISRSRLYEEMKAGRLKFIQYGARRLIRTRELERFLQTLEEHQDG
jgi:excisionase family DNA binding protein